MGSAVEAAAVQRWLSEPRGDSDATGIAEDRFPSRYCDDELAVEGGVSHSRTRSEEGDRMETMLVAVRPECVVVGHTPLANARYPREVAAGGHFVRSGRHSRSMPLEVAARANCNSVERSSEDAGVDEASLERSLPYEVFVHTES